LGKIVELKGKIMKRKVRFIPLIVLLIFYVYPFFYGIGADSSRKRIALNKKIQTENKNPLQNYPDFVRIKNSNAEKVYENDKGFWEAEYEYGIIMIYIPSGEFQMGSDHGKDNEKPLRSVYLDGYWIGKYEVTFDQYDQYCDEVGIVKPDDEGWGRDIYPVINISWLDAMAYCRWLSDKIGHNFKLPTESQWEKAARGTDGRMYPWGDSFPSDDKANFNDRSANFVKHTTPIGSYPEGSSPYGVLDMAGNVYEWCLDWHSSAKSSSSLKRNPRGPKKGDYRVLCGGSWFGSSQCIRTTFRSSAKPTSRYFHIGAFV
jgi:formylglycine-generating enzyme required for sulfatase activity